MEVTYKTRQIERICESQCHARKKYGMKMAILIQQRIDELHSATNVECMIQYRIGRCHPLHNNRHGQYALDLDHPYRLVFTVKGNEIQIANVEEIVDYH